MKILLLTENYATTNFSTGKIVKKLIDFDKNINYVVVCKGNDNRHYQLNNSEVYQMPSYYTFGYKNLSTFLYKGYTKIVKHFYPHTLLDRKRFFKLACKIMNKGNGFDAIISVSGWFSTHEAATRIGKKFRIPVYLVYTDPFVGNLSLTHFKEKRLIKIEKPWLTNSKSIFMPQNYIDKYFNIYENNITSKIIDFELPCITEKINSRNTENFLIYTGGISNRIKDYAAFDSFLYAVDTHVECFGEKPKKASLKNVMFHERVPQKKLKQYIEKAKAILVFDNYFGIQIPSKAIEAVSTNKKIIFIYYQNDTACYEFYKKYDDILFVNFDFIDSKETIKNIKSYLEKEIDINRRIYTNESQIIKVINKLKS